MSVNSKSAKLRECSKQVRCLSLLICFRRFFFRSLVRSFVHFIVGWVVLLFMFIILLQLLCLLFFSSTCIKFRSLLTFFFFVFIVKTFFYKEKNVCDICKYICMSIVLNKKSFFLFFEKIGQFNKITRFLYLYT